MAGKMTRSEIMSRIKSKDTGPELAVFRELRLREILFDSHADLPGKPDIRIGKLAVFIHGCFWHGCPTHYREPKSNQEFWQAKLIRNMRRDLNVRRKLNELGLRTMVVWEHEIRSDPSRAADRIIRRSRSGKSGPKRRARCSARR